MDQIIAKITNFGYELLGIFVPGAITMLFLLFLWWCLGPLTTIVSFGYLPVAQLEQLSQLVAVLNEDIRGGMVIGISVAAYFLGHTLHWISRSGKSKTRLSGFKRICHCLTFSVPKPPESFHSALQPHFDEAKGFFGLSSDAEWRQFYPVAKAYLAANLQSSLVSTYQNKYTLHRSIAAAATLWFWLSAVMIVVAVIQVFFNGQLAPKWLPLSMSLPASLLLIWGFSDSYMYNWRLFGDTIITEIFMIQRHPTK